MILAGELGLPKPSPKKLARATRTPCFTSAESRSCKQGCHSLYCARSSATRLESRMWPASPQSITLWATHRRVHAGKKRQHHSVTSRQANQFTCGVGRTKLRGTADELVQQLEKL